MMVCDNVAQRDSKKRKNGITFALAAERNEYCKHTPGLIHPLGIGNACTSISFAHISAATMNRLCINKKRKRRKRKNLSRQ
jgi:hypothetical protein